MHNNNIVRRIKKIFIFAESMVNNVLGILPRDLAAIIDHTNLMPTATRKDIEKLCQEAREYHFASVCVNSSMVAPAVEYLEGSGVAVCSVVGFPLGVMDSYTKAEEATSACRRGVAEIDMVVNNGYLFDGDMDSYFGDINHVATHVAKAGGKVLKCIIEAGYLTPKQVQNATEAVVKAAGYHPGLRLFTKTSTGMAIDKLLTEKYGSRNAGARAEDLQAIAAVHAQRRDLSLGIKASGGIRTFDDALTAVYAMGLRDKKDLTPDCYRIGASASVQIVS